MTDSPATGRVANVVDFAAFRDRRRAQPTLVDPPALVGRARFAEARPERSERSERSMTARAVAHRERMLQHLVRVALSRG
jgi:hypothetical protein